MKRNKIRKHKKCHTDENTDVVKDAIKTYLSRDLLTGDPELKSLKDITDIIETRYCNDFFQKSNCKNKADGELVFDLTQKSISKLFEGRDMEFSQKLSYALLQMLVLSYSNINLNVPEQYFLASIIHVCFDKLKENSDAFVKIFSLFDATQGTVCAFCRFIVICEIEGYCSFKITKPREWHEKIILFDSEVFERFKKNNVLSKIKVFDMVNFLWDDQAETLNDKNEHIHGFIPNSDSGSVSDSTYWYYRKFKK